MELTQTSIVVVAEGFTPDLLRGAKLDGIFRRPPTTHLSTPLVTTAEFDGFSLVAQTDRLEVRQLKPPGFTTELTSAARRMLGYWPLAEPRALGLNFILAKAFDQTFTFPKAFAFVDRPRVRSVLGKDPEAERHAFSFRAHGARITLNVGDGKIATGELAAVVDVNVNFDRPGNIPGVLRTGSSWLERARVWSEKIVASS